MLTLCLLVMRLCRNGGDLIDLDSVFMFLTYRVQGGHED
jgi:hypothetical protein